eukprot:TRINITY_DN14244_c0_g1_i1.p1 TRINITY_DN14244_c0_g1~~TRINITY_DN14244_c0_g1_i1.p1  ORF type:complete len:161 (-),score=31.73 TRINITY_DN14244_c0_g1_i1:48-530(-)
MYSGRTVLQMEENGVLTTFIETIPVKGIDIDDALRLFLRRIAIPPSSKKVSRLLTALSNHFYQHSMESFKSADQVFTIFYSILMLNTDLHNTKIKRKISEDDFVNRMIQTPDIGLPREFFQFIFQKIKSKPLMDDFLERKLEQEQDQSLWSRLRNRLNRL